jgi:hypothetical protein
MSYPSDNNKSQAIEIRKETISNLLEQDDGGTKFQSVSTRQHAAASKKPP